MDILYLGKAMPATFRNVFEDNEYMYHEINQNTIDIKEFVKNKIRNINSDINFIIINVENIHEVSFESIKKLKDISETIFEGFKKIILILKGETALDIKRELQGHSHGGKNYAVIEESDDDMLTQKVYDYIQEELKSKGKKVEVAKIEEVIGKEKDIESSIQVKEKIAGMKPETNKEVRSRKISDDKSIKEIVRNDNIKDIKEKKEFKVVKAEKIEIPKKETVEAKVKVAKNKPNLIPDRLSRIEEPTWTLKERYILVLGVENRVGTSFIAMSLTQHLSSTEAYATYNLQDAQPNALDDKAQDYSLKKEDMMYLYNNTIFAQQRMDPDAHFIVIDASIKDLARLIQIYNPTYTLLVSDGNTSGLRQLDRCIAKINRYNLDYDIMIVNPIFDYNRYDFYSVNNTEVYLWKYSIRPTDVQAIQQNSFYRITEKLQVLEKEELSKQMEKTYIQEMESVNEEYEAEIG